MKGAYYIPDGIKNLKPMFPTVKFDDVEEYFLEVLDNTDTVVATTVTNKICTCGRDDKIRIFFLNYCGSYDAVNFQKPTISHEDDATEFKNGLSHPLNKTDTGIERFNVRSNDTYEVRQKCKEEDQKWLQELADSPKMFMEWLGTEGQADDYIPIVKIAGKFDKQKNKLDYEYEFVLQFKLSNEFITVRN